MVAVVVRTPLIVGFWVAFASLFLSLFLRTNFIE